MANPLQHPDGCFYYRSGSEIVSCQDDMSEVYPNDMIPPDDPEFVERRKVTDAQSYARNREAEYPSIAELTVALYDTSDKAALVAKRAAVKLKFPKP